VYEENLKDYLLALEALDEAYAAAVAAVRCPRVLFADRFPFVYTMEDYGIEYVAAFRGCTTETDASFETVIRLASRVDEWGLSCVLTTEHPIEGLAAQICANTQGKNQRILAMRSLQSVTKKQLESGVTYLDTMTQNLSVLKEVLTN
jgi:zinc transport system substrate-binding protein